jgi:hypothetical protein
LLKEDRMGSVYGGDGRVEKLMHNFDLESSKEETLCILEDNIKIDVKNIENEPVD